MREFLVQWSKVSSLKQICLVKIRDMAIKSEFTSENDVEITQSYLGCLPRTARQELAVSVLENKRSPIYIHGHNVYYGHSENWSKFLLWRAICMQPDVTDAPLDLSNMACNHYTRYALLHLSKDHVSNIDSSSLILGLRQIWSVDPLPHSDSLNHLCTILPKFTRLSEVTLGFMCGDEYLETIGRWCQHLKKLTLSFDDEVTNKGFVSFAQHQRENSSLEEIVFICSSTGVSLTGLAQVWLLPLKIKKLRCTLAQFDYQHNDTVQLECPNGPSQLTHLWIHSTCPSSIEHSQERVEKCTKRVLDNIEAIFPSLQCMEWDSPPGSWLTSDKTWDTVTSIEQRNGSTLSFDQLKRFPNIRSFTLSNVTNQLISSLCGYMKHLTRFIIRSQHDTPFTFAMFKKVLMEVQSLRVIYIYVIPTITAQYTDKALCEAFDQCKSAKHLESFILYRHNAGSDLPLTNKSVNCILQKCPKLKFLGDLSAWTLDERDEVFYKEKYVSVSGTGAAELLGHAKMEYYGRNIDIPDYDVPIFWS